ncbi:ferritin-like domain-containing protein [Pacificimonas sp. WHA3]|uniref:Ferritin-like domain-containing protein n=1 Tax=Pacificimonas pallii TaxID=2827236 RepID=A0ABS6SGV9_9SPHN|nr:ferritin-like domain-containing protein [Pacificimonas pallii]MBV7257647.1 ferritin-like domain-containing protein [Pacificimonas pallii]
MSPAPRPTVSDAARAVLLTADPHAKAAESQAQASAWRAGKIDWHFTGTLPDRPARPGRPELLAPGRMPRRGRAGSERSRIALMHALAHIEMNAIDLAWDAAARFGGDMPRTFTTDWISVGDDEARHFLLLADRLAAMGAAYGDLPAHDGLWQAAEETADDLLARLAIVPQVLEARGLDVSPATVDRLEKAGDADSAAIVDIIYHDEIGHVRIGNHWFRHVCALTGKPPAETFRNLVETRFRGRLKPPFNDSARESAGLTRDFYASLESH